MLKNIIKTVIRNIKLKPGYSLINMLGLAVGMACSVLIIVFVKYELSYDRFHVKAERTYRAAQRGLVGNTEINQVWTMAPMAATMYKEFPEIETIARITDAGQQTVQYGDQVFIEKGVLTADSTLFDIFTLPFVQGTPKGALNQPNTVVITESTANKYFGDENPIHKVIKMSDGESETDFQVTGVIKDIPDNSHFHFDFVISLVSFDGFYNVTEWDWNNFRTYVVIHENSDFKELESKMPAFMDKYLFGGKYSALQKERGGFWEIYFQPLTDIHLNSDINGEFETNGNRLYVYIFVIVAVFILLIACINFMNLSTAKSSTRAKEIGVRKAIGAGRNSLIIQFLGESVFISMIALFIGIVLVEVLMPAYGNMLGRNLEIHYFNNIYILPLLILLAFGVGIVSGAYPALFLSSFKPVSVLKGKFQGGSKRPWLRNGLVVIQFSISIALIISTMVVYKQLMFIQNERLGFDKEHVIVLKNPYALGANDKIFMESLKQFQGIESVSASTRIPGKRFSNIGFHYGEKTGFTLNLNNCDEDFLKVMDLEMVNGRFFSKEFPTDSSGIIVNESTVSLLGLDEPIGKIISANTEPRTPFHIIGVIKDFYYESKRQKIRPMAFIFLQGSHVFNWTPSYISLRVKPGNNSEVISFIETNWKKYAGGLPVEYSFLDEEYDILYKNEMQTRKLFIVFSILAVCIACLGLFGLASFMAEQRTKEIGIRKVLGATISGVSVMLSKEFIKWVIAANIIAWPVAYYAMNQWLENYAYRIDVSWWIFVSAGLVALFIALLTVSYQTIRAARSNPIESLRYE